MNLIKSILFYFPKWSASGYLIYCALICAFFALSFAVASKKGEGKLKAVVRALLPAFVIFIYSTGVLTRTVSENPVHYFRPFWSYQKAWETWGWDIRKEILINILSFIPMGLMLPVIIKKRKLLWSLLGGFSFSVIIEVSQLILSRGSFEFDDMFHNTLGTFIGYLFYCLFENIISYKKSASDFIITDSQKALLSLVSASLFGNNYKLHESVSLSEVFSESVSQAVSVIVFENITESLSDEKTASRVRVYNRSMTIKSAAVSYEHTRVHNLFCENRIEYVIIKGNASAYYYPMPEKRAMGDVDILIKECDKEKVYKLLSSYGYSPKENSENESHLAFYKKTQFGLMCLEVHHRVPGIPQNETGEMIMNYLSDTIETAVVASCADGEFLMPDEFHHGLILLLHTASHLINSGVGLRHVCDWAVFNEKIGSERFSDIFGEKLKAVGLWHFAVLLTRLCEKYLGLSKQQWAEEKISEKLLDNMMSDILSGGNFGQKNPERVNQSKLITNGEDKSVSEKSMTSQLSLTLKEKAKRAFSPCEKHSLLLPFGIIYVSIRHLLRIKKGTRPCFHPGETLSGARERKSIYKEFHLFEIK